MMASSQAVHHDSLRAQPSFHGQPRMRTYPKALMLPLLIAFAPTAQACYVLEPVKQDMHTYEAIFLGEVTGVRLRGYENLQLGRPDGCLETEVDTEPVCFNLTSDPPISLFALPHRVFQGDVTDVLELDQAGCNRTEFELKQRALFFAHSEEGSAIVVWEDQPEFREWLDFLNTGSETP